MGRQLGWMVTRTGRPAMRSPGRPPGSTRSGAGVLGQGRRGSVERGCGGRVRGVGSGGVALVPRAWRDAVDPARCVVGQVSVVR